MPSLFHHCGYPYLRGMHTAVQQDPFLWGDHS